jgi:AcrR family transcriptional regulator
MFTLHQGFWYVNGVHMMTLPKPEKSYHHGNLRLALMAIAEEVVRSGGGSTFSLREAAHRAGVTPGAVYKHFASKGALLAALAAAGFERLGRRVAEAQSNAPHHRRLPAIGLAYVDFAADEPHLFSLMFGPAGPGAPRDSIASPRGGVFDALRDAVAERQGIAPEAVSAADLALAWAAAHGAARLVTDGLWKRDDSRIALAIETAAAAIAQRR